jgi:flagellar biosynthesis/type III secretory pathway protein FliH
MDSLVDFQHRRAHQLRFLLQWRETKRVQAREQRDLSQYNEGWRAGGQVAQERAYKQGHWDGFKDAYQENCLHINAAVLAMNYAAANMGPRPFT